MQQQDRGKDHKRQGDVQQNVADSLGLGGLLGRRMAF
jgi:hypothetical protein